MKLSFLLILFAIVSVAATGNAQNLSLKVDNVEVRQAIKNIEQSSDYRFFYTDGLTDLNLRVSLDLQNQNINNVLTKLFDDTQLAYRIVNDNLIMLAPKTVMQQKVLTGTIVDESGDPIPGVNVLVKGTTIGVVTDIDGKFSIRVPDASTVLSVSFIGYVAQEFPVGARTSFDITLVEETVAIGEVVVTALGMTREKKALGYSMTEIKGDEILKSSVVNPVNALQGKVAGVQINMGSSGPQSSQRILIRGNTSISGNNQPIFVIDGVVIDNETTKTGDKDKRDFGNDIKNLNSDDFETVSVLKGAAATALYGSRASNGVILITTKKGKKGEGLGISFSHTQSWDKVYKVPAVQNEFGNGNNTTAWALNADGTDNRVTGVTSTNFGPRFDGLDYTYAKNLGSYTGPYKAYENNLKDFYQTGRNINSNLAISGGNEKSTFRFSYSNLTSEGVTPNNDFKRNSFSVNATHDISKIVTASAGFSYVNAKVKNPTYQGEARSPVYDFLYSVSRSYDLDYWRNNYVNSRGDGYNYNDPWEYTKTLYEYYANNEEQDEDNFRANLGLDFKLTNWLKLSLKGDLNRYYTTYEVKRLSRNSTSNYNEAYYEIDDRRKEQYRVTAMLSANHRVGDLGLSGSVAVEQWDTRSAFHKSYTNGGLRIPGYFDITNSKETTTTDGRLKDRKRINSLYAFLNMDWKRQIYLDITGRNDWSSSLRYTDGSGNVSYFYPSFGLSWLATETFAHRLPEAISFIKLRASYAIVGQDCDPYAITNPGSFKYQDIYNNGMFGGSGAYYKFVNEVLGAANLKPEKQHAIEFGADIKFLDNRLGLDFAYYKTNTKNQILELSVPKESGAEFRLINAGNIQNSGIELLLTGVPVRTTDWYWDISLNMTRNRNKIKELTDGVERYKLKGGGMETDGYAVVGGTYGEIYSNHAFNRDNDGNKLLDPNGKWLRAGIPTKIGRLEPDFLAGLSSNLTWKSLSFGVVFDARFGGDIMSGSYNYGMSSGTLNASLYGRTEEYGGVARKISANDPRIVHDGMIPDGVFAAPKKGTETPETIALTGNTYQWAIDNGYKEPISAYTYYQNLHNWDNGIREAAIKEISWIALREISLFWNIPAAWTNRIFVKNASIGFVVRNVGYLYNSLPDDIHPEGLVTSYGSEYREGGGSLYSRNYSVKLNLNF